MPGVTLTQKRETSRWKTNFDCNQFVADVFANRLIFFLNMRWILDVIDCINRGVYHHMMQRQALVLGHSHSQAVPRSCSTGRRQYHLSLFTSSYVSRRRGRDPSVELLRTGHSLDHSSNMALANSSRCAGLCCIAICVTLVT